MKKGIISTILSLTLVLGITNTGAFASEINDNTTKITIIHSNDTHGRVLADDGGFGFAKIASIAKEEKKENPNTLLLDAGDTLHGKPIINISEGENAVKILDAAGYDFMVPGNHDFNYGNERLLELSKLTKNFKVINANIEKNGEEMFEPYEIVNMNGINVAIFGLTTPETAYKTNPLNVKGVEFLDPIKVAKEMVEELDDKSDVIIALTHIGLDESSVVTSKEIAEKVDGIDVIIDGHSHTELQDGLVVNNTLIAQTGEYDKNLGKVEIEVADHKVINKTAELLKAEDYETTKEDENVVATIDKIKAENETIFSEVIAKSDIELDGARENVRTKETNLGNLSADAVRTVSKTDIAFLNGGGIRTSIEKGDVTKGKIAELFPFGNIIQVIKLDGNNVKKALEASVSGYPEQNGAFLQVSGITFAFDPSKAVGERVSDVKVKGVNIDENKDYTVAINDFLAVGGDGYDMFKQDVIAEFGTLEEIFADYLNSNGTKNCEVGNRIVLKESANNKTAVADEDEKVSVTAQKSKEKETISSDEKTYVVVMGDNLTMIANRNNTTWQALAKYNNIKNADLIYPGDEIKIIA